MKSLSIISQSSNISHLYFTSVPEFCHLHMSQATNVFQHFLSHHVSIWTLELTMMDKVTATGTVRRAKLQSNVAINKHGTGRYSNKCFWKGATNTNSNPNRNLNPNSNPNPLHYPFRNVGIAVVGIAAVGIAAASPTNQHPIFYRQDVLPVGTKWKHWRCLSLY